MREFYGFDEKALALLDRLDALCRETIAPAAAAVDREGSFPRAQLAALGAGGFLGLTIDPAQGGLGQGPRVFAAVVETLARACGSTAMTYLMHVCATQVIAAHGGREPLLREIAAGRHLTTLAFSEKGSRSHFWAPVSKEAKLPGGGRRLVAEKSFVTSAGEAASYVVSTLAAEASTAVESSLYLVPAGTPGLGVAGRFDGLGLRGNASAPMRLEGVDVGDADRVSPPGKGFDVMMGVVLPWFQLGAAAVAVGTAEAAFGATAAHIVGARFEHMGATLAEALPNLRAQVATMRTEIDRSRAQVVFTAGAMVQPGAHTMPAVLSAKLQAAEMALAVTDSAMRVCGGAAFSKQLGVERHFRDARAGAVMAPTSDALRDFLGKAVLGLPLF
jgi:alkylation response protein AidB-like acyl-CoA dehydrogenase